MLYIACKNKYDILVKYLVEHRTNVNKQDIYGYTPLHLVCNNKYENICI